VEQDQVHDMDKFNTGTDVSSMSASGIVTVTAGQDLDIRMRHDKGGTVAVTPIYASLLATKIG